MPTLRRFNSQYLKSLVISLILINSKIYMLLVGTKDIMFIKGYSEM